MPDIMTWNSVLEVLTLMAGGTGVFIVCVWMLAWITDWYVNAGQRIANKK